MDVSPSVAACAVVVRVASGEAVGGCNDSTLPWTLECTMSDHGSPEQADDEFFDALTAGESPGVEPHPTGNCDDNV